MKNFLILCLQLGFFAFALGAVLAIVNYLTGWHLGIKGAEVPADPIAAVIFLIIAGICGGLSHLLTRKKAE